MGKNYQEFPKTLDKRYGYADFQNAYPGLFCPPRIVCQFFLPTERVVEEPQFVVPDVARVYSTPFFWFVGSIEKADRQFLAYDDVIKLPGFQGTGCTPGLSHIYVIELWDNHGDDGHVQYGLEGYAFFESKEDPMLKKLSNLMHKALNFEYIGR